MSRSRAWVFTINNWTTEDFDIAKKLPADYIIIGRETGESGTPHLQGYAHFSNAKTLTACSKLMPRAHLAVARGSPQQNTTYCSKSDLDPWVTGDMPMQGKRNDLESLKADVDTLPLKQVADLHFAEFLRYGTMIKVYKSIQFVDRTTPPRVEWIWGSTGCGKTRYAASITPLSFYIKDGTMWWDGYEQQQTIIIDDFDGKWPFRDLLRLLDRYPYQGQFKGGYIKINSPTIVITADAPPSTRMAHLAEPEYDQLVRRIHQVTCLSNLACM